MVPRLERLNAHTLRPFVGRALGRADQVAEPAISAYLGGLRLSGWDGDERLVCFGCLGNLAVRVTSGIADLVHRAIDEGHPLQVRDPQRLKEPMAHYAESLDYLLVLAEETKRLLAWMR